MKTLRTIGMLSPLMLLAAFATQCSSSKLKGDVQSVHSPAASSDAPSADASAPSSVQTPSPAVVQNPQAPASSASPDLLPEKQEVLKSCNECLARANELSESIGFTADMQYTRNIGYYKIDPEYGLCDIHFMKNLRDQIVDHDGVTSSVFSNQVVLYCPCDCDWAVKPRRL